MSEIFIQTSDDSTRRMFGGWRLGGDGPTEDAPLDDSLLAPLARPQPVAGGNEPDHPGHDFTINLPPPGPKRGPRGSSLDEPRRNDAVPADGRAAGNRTGTNATAFPFSNGAPPKPGEVIGGFKIVTELGRGAFARVYLAEQIELANRPVALKVSRAEGEEPRMLARLQHTHIVPIHSVHDDPTTGLRLLCMPYLGGANLAQVLEAAGGRVSDGPDRRSLVRALDEVSHRLQSGAALSRGSLSAGASRFPSGLASVSPLSPPAGGKRASGAHRAGVVSRRRDVGSRTRLRRAWDRLTQRGDRREARAAGGASGLDFDQPARRFLSEAGAVAGAVWVVARLAEGLEHAHTRGLLHRDLKPSNILIAADGTPMLLDFNLSSSTDSSDPAEGEKAMLGGTLPYMSPEHLDAFDPRGSTSPSAVDERSDLYALGLILFEMVAGDHPFPEPRTRMPLLETVRYMARQRRAAPSLRAANPATPWSLDSIVKKCLDPDPSRRYARARDLADDLKRFLDDSPLRHASDPSPRERLTKWARRNPRLCGNSSIAAFSAVLIVALGGLIGLLHGNMRNLSTRLKLQVFRDDFTECRFLLNLTSGPVEHLRRGIALADRTLDDQGLDRSGDWRPGSWARMLTGREQAELREQVAELIIIESRARVHLAGRTGKEADRRRALEWAVNWLNRAERLDPTPPAALYADRARYHAALGQSDLAGRDRRHEAGSAAVSGRDFTLKGSSLLASGDLDGAEPALVRAVDLDPRGFWAWFGLGHCHLEQGRPLEAAGDFAVCVVLEPRFAWPFLNRGLCLARAGRLVEARSAYDRALEVNPRFAEAWVNHALVDLELGDLPAAEHALDQARTLGRREADMLAVWAEIKARRGDPASAETLFEPMLRARPRDPVLLTARGIFRIAHNPDAARADLLRALEVDPRNARAHFGLSMLLRVAAPSRALAEADAALAADPNLLDALQLRALLRARLGDPGAIDDAERLIQSQTPHRLYNASCALALLVKTADNPRLTPRALDLLGRALDSGFPAAHAAADPDLNALHDHPRFKALLARAPRPDPPLIHARRLSVQGSERAVNRRGRGDFFDFS